MIWPWQRERHAKQAVLAALGASVEDERLDPDRILEAARAEFTPLTRRWRGDAVAPLRAHFGTAQIGVLLRLRAPGRHQPEVPAEPLDVRMQVRPHPKLAVVDFRVVPETGRAEATVYVTANARSWIDGRAFGPARLRGLVIKTVLMLLMPVTGIPPFAFLPIARSRGLHALWVFELAAGARRWTFQRFESMPSGDYRLISPLDNSSDLHQRLRDDLVLEEAAEDSAGVKIPWEIAQSLPYDARAALVELSGLYEAFVPDVLEASLRRILELWGVASEGEHEALDAAAGRDAANQLLSPPGTVLRGGELLRVKPLRVCAFRVPPEITVQVDVRAYVGPADPEHNRNPGIRRKHRMWWRLARQESETLPWRLVDAEVDPFRP